MVRGSEGIPLSLRWLITSQRIVASLCAVLLLLLSACDIGSDPQAKSTTQPPSNAVCLDAQREAFPGLVSGWRKVAIDMTAVDNGTSGNPESLDERTG